MDKSVYVKYLFANEEDKEWGTTINSVGYQHVYPNSIYPPESHPASYLFSDQRGRVLNEYQLLYITRGSGLLRSQSFGGDEVKEGTMFLIFPGEWHSYAPEKTGGWDEYWIGFEGSSIDNRVSKRFFEAANPLFAVGLREDIVDLYKKAIDIATEQRAGYQQLLAGIVDLLLGHAYSQNKHASFDDLKVVNQINKAKIIIRENFRLDISPEEVANRVNMSYSWFRRLFKQYTGFGPAQYILELKIQHSKELLASTLLNSQQIAYEAGLSNADYFCTVFKKKTGVTPIRYREITQGKRNS